MLAQRLGHSATPVIHVKLHVDVAHVPVDGMRTEKNPFGDLVLGVSLDQQLQDLTLPVRQAVVGLRSRHPLEHFQHTARDLRIDGRTTVEHVTPGSYTLEVLDGDDVVARRPVVVREGQTAQATID